MRTVDLGRPIELLLVEDNAADVRLLQEALKELKMPTQLSTVADGLEALAFLRREGRYAQALQPDLILLDLNLPGKSGLEVLAEISAHPHLRHIPLVVLTSSAAEQDILQSYMLCANCFITKPVDLEHFLTAIRVLGEFWFTVVQLPSALGQPLA
jgi:chemotaxis family two-component system response regulator Rcp1